MFRRIIFSVCMLAVYGCAPPPRPDETSEAPQIPTRFYETAACHCETQCSVMWSHAPDELQHATRMRIRLATDTMLETYSSSEIGYTTGQVLKIPDGHGGATFEGTFTGAYRGDQLADTSHAHFNAAMNLLADANKCAGT